jgi:hypothetical protein
MPELKNPIFVANITDPLTQKQVKKIYQVKISKIGRIVEPMVWEYYSNRANMSIEQVYTKFHGYKLKIIFFNDPVIYEIDNGANGVVKYSRADNPKPNVKSSGTKTNQNEQPDKLLEKMKTSYTN